MGEEAESLYDDWSEYLNEKERAERRERIETTRQRLAQKPNRELLYYLCSKGPMLNTFPKFQTYDVARRLLENGWTPTSKQRAALINTVAIALNSD
jgi:hypothetical protein